MENFMTDCEWWDDYGAAGNLRTPDDYGAAYGECGYPQQHECSEHCPRYRTSNEDEENEDD